MPLKETLGTSTVLSMSYFAFSIEPSSLLTRGPSNGPLLQSQVLFPKHKMCQLTDHHHAPHDLGVTVPVVYSAGNFLLARSFQN